MSIKLLYVHKIIEIISHKRYTILEKIYIFHTYT